MGVDLHRLEIALDTMSDDLVPHTVASLDREPTSREQFLLDEGLEMVASYRSIGDPDVRQMVRRLLACIATSQTREQ